MKNYSVDDTLCFFYFGITPDEINKDDILEKIIRKALFDATMQNAFNAKVELKYKKMAKEAKENTIDELIKSIKELKEFKRKESFDNWHKETCEAIRKKFENIKDEDSESIFTYGNAQKVVNMTLKYLYLLSKLEKSKTNNCSTVISKIEEYAKENFLHMPIDSYIIDQLFRKEIIDIKEKFFEEKLRNIKKDYPKRKKLKECLHPYEYIKPWSKWEEQEYTEVQKQIHDKMPNTEGYCVIDWENDLWLEEAKSRRDNHKNE